MWRLDAGTSYIVAGGLGDLCRVIIEAMVCKGEKNLAAPSRPRSSGIVKRPGHRYSDPKMRCCICRETVKHPAPTGSYRLAASRTDQGTHQLGQGAPGRLGRHDGAASAEISTGYTDSLAWTQACD